METAILPTIYAYCFWLLWPRAGRLPPARGCALALLPCRVWNTHFLQCQLLLILRETVATTCLHCPWSGRNWPQASTTDYRGEAGGARTSVTVSHLLMLHPGRQGRAWSEWRERPHTRRLRAWGLWSDEPALESQLSLSIAVLPWFMDFTYLSLNMFTYNLEIIISTPQSCVHGR